ncbi:overexpressed in colon carcinoma 1 protein-like [Clinocottus analis]|uniref:overexpressed in colon carcinoma 1 protein-like n=1 Tax=Clinocottus analis TaxID=304258 RepID=UPI0035C118EB
MGCGNSSPAGNNNNNNSSSSSNTGDVLPVISGRAESTSKISEESVAEDDKWRNYGGVYVGFPADLSNIPEIQIGSLKERDLQSLRRPLWGDGF